MKKKIVPFLIYLYLSLPFLIFSLGFVSFPASNAFSLAIIFSIVFAASNSEGLASLKAERTDAVKITAGLFIICAVVLLSGIGNILWQNNDHATRNTIFDILVNYSWPPKETVSENEVGLIYYIGFWLPSALLGKLTTLEAGYIFSVIWAIMGMALIWYLLCLIHKKVVLYPLVFFLCFSGLDVVGRLLAPLVSDSLSTLQVGKWAFKEGSKLTYHLEWWAKNFQYSSHITQLFWVFNQSLPVWIATLMLLLEKNNKNLVFIMGVTLLSSPLPFVGLIPIFLWCAFTNHNEPIFERTFTKNFKESFLSLFTFQNVLGGGYSGIITFFYLKGNIASGNTSSQATSSQAPAFNFLGMVIILGIWAFLYFVFLGGNNFKKIHLLYLLPAVPVGYMFAKLNGVKPTYYILFLILEVGVYALIALKKFKKSSLYFIVVVSLLLIPFFVVGKSIDFCMRASVPALLVLCLLVTDAVKDFYKTKQSLAFALSIAVLFVGSITPFTEIARTVEATVHEIKTKGKVENDSKEVSTVFKGKNFTGQTKDNFFFEYLSD